MLYTLTIWKRHWKCEIVLYADDTLLFTDYKTDNLSKLKLNENETKLLEINMDNSIIFQINNVIIEKVNSIKYLSFIIDKEIKCNDHREFIFKKFGVFKRIKNRKSTPINFTIR